MLSDDNFSICLWNMTKVLIYRRECLMYFKVKGDNHFQQEKD